MVDPPPPPPIEIPVFCPGCGIRLQDHSLNRPGFYRVPKTQIETPEAIVCERCYSLTHYGRLKSQDAEKLIPHFNVETVLKPKLLKTKGKKLVIICVVDLFDFDASLPLKELRSLFLESSPFYLDLLIVGNKFDLLPKSLSKESVEIWVRTRLREHRLNAVKDVHLISSQTLQGVRELMTGLKNRIKRNTDCYIIGMQNAGKSSMLNALTQVFDKDSKDRKTDLVTAAFLPGTTLGFVKVTGFPVGKSCRVFDTPGLLQSTQVTSRLNLEELKLVQPRRMLKPRTYRFGTGNSLLIGGLVRLDLTSCPGRTLYVTIWVADMLTCYLGKTENVELKLQKHTGEKLVPPLKMLSDQDSGFELLPRTVRVSGDSWKGASTDICIGGNVIRFSAFEYCF